MNTAFAPTGGTGLAERLARCLPGASFELETLVRLVGIEETESVPTAAVTCRGRARLLINPRFVAEHCRRDEHLFLLVMHELWHVLLGHTTLYKRPTLEHNLAFDAIINAGLTRQHPEPAYRGFFDALNPHDVFPALLLRPPLGWPHQPDYEVPAPSGTERLIRRLYPAPGCTPIEPTYDELLALLRRGGYTDAAERTIDAASVGGGRQGDIGRADPVLLGDHGDDEGSALDDPLFGDVVRRIVGSWPPPPIPLGGRDAGGAAREQWITPEKGPAAARGELRGLLRRVLSPDPGGGRRRAHRLEPVLGGPGPVPNPADRLLPAKRALGTPAPLTAQWTPIRRRSPDRPARALVYLDVSGSMSVWLPQLVDLLVPLVRRRLVRVQQFSTVVAPLGLDDLAKGRLTTTDGTDIDCVLTDIVDRPQRRVLLITDGYVGAPRESLAAAVRDRGVRVHAALPAYGWDRDLTGFAEITRLSLEE